MSDTTETTGSVTTEKRTYRNYGEFKTTDDGQGNVKTILTKTSVNSETDKKEPDLLSDGKVNPLAGLSVSWANSERAGLTLINENEVITYTLKSLEGFELIVPDPAMRLYIAQVGLNSIQTARANAFMKAFNEEATEIEPAYNGVTLDLRVGIDDDGNYSFNKAPSRRSSTDEEKLAKILAATGKTPEQIKLILALIAAQTAVPAEAQEQDSSEGEGEGEVS